MPQKICSVLCDHSRSALSYRRQNGGISPKGSLWQAAELEEAELLHPVFNCCHGLTLDHITFFSPQKPSFRRIHGWNVVISTLTSGIKLEFLKIAEMLSLRLRNTDENLAFSTMQFICFFSFWPWDCEGKWSLLFLFVCFFPRLKCGTNGRIASEKLGVILGSSPSNFPSNKHSTSYIFKIVPM